MGLPFELPELSTVLVASAWKGALVIALAGIVSFLVARHSAAVRHLVWCSALLALLAIPLADAVLPAWQMTFPAELIARFHFEAETEVQPVSESALNGSGLVREAESPADHTPPEGEMAAPNGSASESAVPQSGLVSGAAASKIALPPLATLVWFIWLGGFLFVLADILVGHLAAWNTTRRAIPVDGPARRIMEEAAATLAIERNVDLRSSRRILVPCTWGAANPTVLLPDEYTDWSRERLRMVLTHELGHARRFDWVTQTLTHVACAIHWFNPLVWVARAKMIREQEAATDDLVLDSGSVAHEYATNLLDIARTMRRRDAMFTLAHATIAMSRPSSLEGRLVAILDESRRRTVVYGRRVMGTSVLVSALLLPLAVVQPSAAVPDVLTATLPPFVVTPNPRVNESANESVDESSDESADKSTVEVASTLITEETDAKGAAAPSPEPVIAVRGEAESTSDAEVTPQVDTSSDPYGEDDSDAPADTAKVRALLAALAAEEDAGVRVHLVRIVGDQKSPLATQPLIGLLTNDPSDEVRRAAAWALGEMEDASAVAALSRALTEDTSTEVRKNAAWALGELDSGESLPALRHALLNDESHEIRSQAAHAIGDHGDDSDVAALESALADPSPNVRQTAAWALGEIASPQSVQALERALSDESAQVAAFAARALGELGGEAVVESLGRATSHADGAVRAAAIWALGEIGSETAIGALATALTDEDEQARVQAAWALGEIGSASSADALIRALDDESAEVRKQVAHALGEIGADNAADALIRMLREDPEAEVRKAAAWALSEMDF